MNCLTESRLQAYFDNELSQSEIIIVKEHLDSCSDCRELYNKLVKESVLIKDSLSQFENQAACTFASKKKSRKGLWISLSGVAASLLLIVMLFQSGKTELIYLDEFEKQMFEESRDSDPNKVWQRKQQTILFDENSGDVIFPS